MSIKIMTWVWGNSPLEGKALLIHLAMADHAGDDGMCWPSQEGLAAKSRSSVRYVRDVINDMIDTGLLDLVEASNGRKNHLYKLRADFRRHSVPAELDDTAPELDDIGTGTLPPKNHHESSSESPKGSATYPCSVCNERGITDWKEHLKTCKDPFLD